MNTAPGRGLEHDSLSLAIDVLRPVLILVMCLAHIPLLHSYPHPMVSLEMPQSVLGPLLRDVLARNTVPALTVISGYLACQSFSYKSYPLFVGDKLRRILLPFLLWNVITLGFLYLLFVQFQVDLGGHIAPIDSLSDTARALLGYNTVPVNIPTYFLRDLFLILLCVPLFHWVTHRAWAGVAVAMLLLGLMMSVLPLFISIGGHGLLYRNDMPLFFLLGYLIARHGIRVPRIGPSTSLVVCLTLLPASVIATVWLAQAKPPVECYLRFRPLLGLGMLAALPFAVNLIRAGRDGWAVRAIRWLSPFSYSIFLSHILIAYAIGANLPDPASRWLHELQIDNGSPLWVQFIYVAAFLIACLGLGASVKTIHDRLTGWLQHRTKASAGY